MKSIRIDVNTMSREDLLDLVKVQSEKLTNQLQGMLSRDARIFQLEEALGNLMEVVEVAGMHNYLEYKCARVVLKAEAKDD